MRVVVVGGGIAGLAAARRLESVAPDAEIVLLERDDSSGESRTETSTVVIGRRRLLTARGAARALESSG